MALELNPIVARTSPNLYAAAKSANLPMDQATQLEQFSWTVQKNKKLNQMSVDTARKEFNELDPDAQEKLKFLFPKADYQLAAPDTSDYLTGTLKFGLKVVASPLIGLFKAAGAFNRVINTPYLIARQASQGEGLFTKETFTDAWDGRRVYDQGALTEAVNYFGNEKVEIAKGLLSGKKPGEIIASAGGEVNQKLLDALEEAYNNPDSFKQVMDGVKYAQVSPGRDIVRMFDVKPPKGSSASVDYIDGKTKNISGAIDFIYQIAVDPLTWVTGGATAAARASVFGLKNQTGTQMRKTIEQFGVAGVRDIFRDNKDVVKLWDEQLGPKIKELVDAPNPIAKNNIRNEIKERFPGYNNDEAIDFLERNRIVDARTALVRFTDAENLNMFMAGKVNGAQYFRNGVATARNQRKMTAGATRLLDRILNPKYGTEDEILKAGEDITDSLIKAGAAREGELIGPEVLDLQKYIKKTKREWLSRALTRTPQGREIKLGRDSIKSADVFRDTARQVLPKDLSDALTYKFINSDTNDQVAILRSLDVAIMQRMGIDGTELGKKFMADRIAEKYGSMAGVAVTEKLPVPIALEGVVSKSAVKLDNNIPMFDSAGIIHPFQERGAVSSLDYIGLAQYAYEAKTRKNLISAMFGGATSSKLSSDIVNAWSLFTLFPRLGIRSAIDEGFIYYLTAPARDLFSYVNRKGHKMSRIANAYSGSKTGEQLRVKVARKLGFTTDADRFDTPERLKMVQNYADKQGVPVESLTALERRVAQASAITLAMRGKGKFKLSDEEVQHLIQGLSLNSQYLTAGTRSVVASASLMGRQSTEVAEEMVNLSELDKAIELFPNLLQGRKGKLVDTAELDRIGVLGGRTTTLVHFENFVKRFYSNTRTNKGTGQNYKFNPVSAFFFNNGLRTDLDFVSARNYLLESIGLSRNTDLLKTFDEGVIPSLSAKITHSVKDPEALKDFLSMTSHTSELQLKGLDDLEIAQVLVDRILLDMRHTFHGSADAFNDNLFTKLKSSYDELATKEIETGERVFNKSQKAAQSITFEEFEELTKGFSPKGKMFTTLEGEGLTDMEKVYTKYGNKAMELMDSQVTAILRQPVVMIKYLDLRKGYAKTEEQLVRKLYLDTLSNYASDGKVLGESAKAAVLEDVTQLAQKRITEIAIKEAADSILKFVDNPSVRTNFAIAVRNTGRYYRATEDFWRRTYRLKDVAPRALYRMRLMHLGLDASGDIYEDANGDPYVMMPMDDAIFKFVDSTVRAITPGEQSFKQPMFNDFTLKLTLANPSFSPDAGLPTLSGPIGALSVITMKSILGQTGTVGKKVGEELDNYALGSIGEGMTVMRAIVPSSIQKLYALVPQGEKSRQEATAAMQAIAYNQAFNTDEQMAKYLDPNASAEDKYNYLKNIRVSAHNIVVMRSLLGLFSPVAPSTQESVNMPEYLREVGITGLRPEFYDLVNAVTQKYKGDIQDPYELAVATFVGKNPGKLIYTVSRDEKQTNVVIEKTKAVKTWAIENQGNINKYGEAAWIVAPHTGEFDITAYTYLEASDLLKNKSLEKYYLDLLVAKDKQAYYDIAKDEKAFLKSTPSYTARKAVVANATRSRALLKASNPLLEQALVAGGNEVATELNMLSNLEEMINDSSINIPIGTRQRLAMVSSRVREFVSLSNDATVREANNFSDIKRNFKMEIEKLIESLAAGDAVLTEANRAIFRAVLSYYSRDTYTAKAYKGY